MAANEVSLNSLRFSVVGPGRVGASLAHWLVSRGATLASVSSRSPDSAASLLRALGGSWTDPRHIDSAETDLLLVAVSDPALPEVVDRLTRRRQADVVLHTSGRVPGEVLSTLRQQGSSVGSFHPLKAFPRVLVDPAPAAGIVFGIDGDHDARAMAHRLADAVSGRTVDVPPDSRSRYHLAATMAAGGVVTLLASAAKLATDAGLGDEVIDGYLSLAAGAIDNAAASPAIADAITGPIARGDTAGMIEQIDEIRALDPALAEFLDILARRTEFHCRALAREPKLPRS